ncbi:protein-export membrane protein SecD [Calothrix sp. NIES-4101]|nr:protein-export membrane protein SecD [Calothrix sp. NIES-4101]
MPGIKDPTQVVRVLGSIAQLEFKKQKLRTETQLFSLLASRNELKVKLQEAQTSKDTGVIAKNQKALENNSKAIAQLFASTKPPLTSRYLKDAYAEPTQGNGWEVAIRFNQEGGDLFTALTKETAGTGRAIGIFLDNELISSPTVAAQYATTGITGGTAVITGRFNATDANNLSVQLRGGALPVPVKVKVVNSGS